MARTLSITYGDRIRRARLEAGLTQDEFAEEIGATQSIVSNHEKMAVPPQRNRKALAKMIQLRYDVDADWLLEGQVTGEYLAPVIPLRRAS